LTVGTVYSVTVPDVVVRPILLVLNSVNQSAPSEPTAMSNGQLLAVGTGYSVIAPVVVIRPILFAVPLYSVNQSAPSGPAVMPIG